MNSRYTQAVLTFIAGALAVLCLQNMEFERTAHAQSIAGCKLDRPIKVEITRLPRDLPGSFSGRPLQVKQVK